MRIAIYSRKSVFIQGSNSIENQIQMCKDYCEHNYKNTNIDYEIFEDEGFSGSNTNRPQFQRMMNRIKNFDVLICYRLDRISRNVADFTSTYSILEQHNVNFISVNERFDTTSPLGKAMLYIASVFANLERETIAERIRDNMLEMAKKGMWSGGRLPTGYDSESSTYIDDEGNERKVVKLVKNEEELKLVNLIYETYLREGSLHKTEVWFTQHNIKSNAGILLEKTSLKIILQNPVYVKSTPDVLQYMKDTGWNVYGTADGVHSLLSYNKTESVTINGKTTKKVKDKSEWIAAMSSVEGVISADLWLAVQKQFDKNRDTFPRLGKTHNAILTGKLKCGLCGSGMTVSHGKISKKTNEQLFYYVCSMKKKSKSVICNNKNLKAKEIEDSVLIELEEIANNKQKYIDNLKKEIKSNSEMKNINKKKLEIEKKIQLQNKKIDKLTDELSEEDDDDFSTILKKKIKALTQELKILKQELTDIDSNIDIKNEELINIDFISSILDKCKNIRKLPKDEQKEIINLIVDDIVYDGNTGDVELNIIGSKKK